MKRLAWVLLLAAVALPLHSCSKDDSNNDSGSLFATFTAANPNPGNVTMSLQKGDTNGSVVSIKVEATGFTDLYGVAYTLTYSPGVMRYIGSSEGDFLRTGGVGTTFQASLEGGVEGRLVVGHSRLGSVTGVSGSGTLHTLNFQAVAEGQTGVNFESARAVDHTGTQIPGLLTSGGTVNVTKQ